MERKTKIAVIFSLLIIAGIGVFAYQSYFSRPASVTAPAFSVKEEANEPPVFTWRFEKAGTLNPDGLPEIDVFLEARYQSGVQEKLIDTTPGGCNILPDSEEDSAANSADMQCYSAGLGYRYKVIKGGSSYLIMRKAFEEASPDYDPPAYEYEMVAEFPFAFS